MTDFSDAVRLTPAGGNRWSADVPADWSQGRTSFGGLLAGFAVEAATRVVGPERPIRSMDVAFIAPVSPGPVEVETEVLGQGRAVTQLAVSIRSAGVLGCRVHVVAGTARPSALLVSSRPTDLVDGDPEDQGIGLKFIPGVTPEFVRNVDVRWCSKLLPFSGGGPESAVIQGWIRHRTAADQDSVAATVALLDAWPPTVLVMAERPVPVSTVSWALHLARPEPGSRPAGSWFWYEARTIQSADGYATAQASLFADGRLVAWSDQLIAVYDEPAPDSADRAPSA